jgi:hypothetical protein
MFDPPKDMPKVSRSEWSERAKEMEETKSRISDLLDWPSLDQKSDGYCVTEDTECLTQDGWIRWSDYNYEDPIATVNPVTHVMEYQKPTKAHVYEYKGEMIYSTNKRVDFGVTPGHRMYVRRWNERKRTLSDYYEFVAAKNLGWYCGLMHAPNGHIGLDLERVSVPDDREYDGDDFFAMLSLVVSDGYAGGSESTRRLVSFCCFDPKRRDRVAELAKRVGFTEQSSRPGVWNKSSIGLANWIRQNCYKKGDISAIGKCLPPILREISQRQINHFLSFYGDKSHTREICPQYTTASKQLADDLQELHLRIGKRSAIGYRGERTSTIKSGVNCGKQITGSGEYTVTVSSTNQLQLTRKNNLTTDRYNGLVYCATVPNGTLITRRNGSVLISGNCWSYSTGGCVMAVRSINNQPYVRLNPHSVAAVIKKGVNEGGWCGLSAKFLRQYGITSEEFWPANSRNYREYWDEDGKANALLHRVTEEWVDLTRRVYDQNLTFEQFMSCLFNRLPCAA